jgi:enolase-phosphatase E1
MSAILLDIEGTVSDKRFVAELLFPFARKRIRDFIYTHANEPDVVAAMRMMIAKLGKRDASLQELATELERWIDEDRKEEPLKTLQGLIWKEGYDSGALISDIYPDVPAALQRWRDVGKRIAVFSSGSVAAQKLLFGHTDKGDLTPFLDAYFDLSTGPKFEPGSYAKIARALDLPPADICFYSDVPREVDAALTAGMAGVLVERDGPIEAQGTLRRIQSFAGE